MDGFEEMIKSINQATQGLKASSNLEEIIGIIRAELYSYFANVNNMLTQFVEKNEKLTEEQVKEWKRIISENNKKFDIMRNDIRTYMDNNNRLFRETTEYLKEISEKVSKPVLIPPPLEIPKEMLEKLDKVIELLEKTHGELEGLYFYTVYTKVNIAGKPVRVADKRKTKSMVIIAENGNAGNIYVGDRGVSSSHAGAVLRPGENIPMDVDLNKREVYINSDNNGDGVNCVIMAYRPETMEGGSR